MNLALQYQIIIVELALLGMVATVKIFTMLLNLKRKLDKFPMVTVLASLNDKYRKVSASV